MALSLIASNMGKTLVLLSGPTAVGKSTVANALINHHGFASIRSGPYLKSRATTLCKSPNRTELQELGDSLDKKTDYTWLINDVAIVALQAAPDQDRWLLDCVRKERQIRRFRERYGAAVLHVHLTAPEEVLRARYEERLAAGGEYAGNTPYPAAAAHPNEISARSLVDVADLTIDLHRVTADQVAITIVENCKGRAHSCEKS